MDRISKALDMARQVRRPVGPIQHAEQEKNITYTQTKRVLLDYRHLRLNRVIPALDDKGIIDAYKLLRTRVMQRMQQNNWKSLGITSAAENEGKSLTALNLAISIAKKLNFTVVLVDADLRRPSLHKILGFAPELGLSDHLESGTPIEDILVHPEIDRLIVLPGKSGVADSSELLASPKMLNLVHELKSRYPSRLVIFDLPPVLVGDDVVSFAPHIDSVMFVIEDDKTQSNELGRALELLENANVIGNVLNKSTRFLSDSSYYYY
jgi:capsular exopolysaccharide synthesis family protein